MRYVANEGEGLNVVIVEKTSAIGRLWELWKRVGKRIGDFQARVLLSFFYYIVFSTFAIAVRWVSDPLAIKDGAPKGWQLTRGEEASPTERATRQF